MGRSPLGQLTNLLACINNKLTHITHTHTQQKQKQKQQKWKQTTENKNVTESKNKKSIDLCQRNLGQEVGKEEKVCSLIWRPSGCPALWTPIECVALSHTHTHTQA